MLIKKTAVKKETILELIAANCIPPHSYTVKQNLIFSSSLLEPTSEDSIVQYYPKSLVSWSKKATQLQTLHDVAAIAKIIREDFINELRQKLAPIGCNDLYLKMLGIRYSRVFGVFVYKKFLLLILRVKILLVIPLNS